MLEAGKNNAAGKDIDHKLDGIYVDGSDLEMQSSITTSLTENNLLY